MTSPGGKKSPGPINRQSFRSSEVGSRKSEDPEDALDGDKDDDCRTSSVLEMQSLLDEDVATMVPQASDPCWRRILASFGCDSLRPKDRYITLTPAWSQNNHNRFPKNIVKNTKYNAFTFLPKVLFEQFKYFFNLYFLIVALSQLIPSLQVGFLFTYVAPLVFVLAVTMLKELYDDFQRWKTDKAANSSKYKKLTSSGTIQVSAGDLRVGDIIHVDTNQRMPADGILLRTTEKSGACFIRTDQLDGETDWKLRHAVSACQKLQNAEDILRLQATIWAEAPHQNIYQFVGTFTSGPNRLPSHTEALDLENTMWRDTVVATGNCVCAIIYTGPQTRSASNTSSPPAKMGMLEDELNLLSFALFILTILLALVLVAMTKFQGYWYMTWFRFVLLFSSIIPISLRVNLDLGKAVCSLLIQKDGRIPGTKVRNSNLPEELGRISYLFSDKTGTLTCNEMYFRRLYLSSSLKFSHNTGLGDIEESLKKYYRHQSPPPSPGVASSDSNEAEGEDVDAHQSSSIQAKKGKRVSVPPPPMQASMAQLEGCVAEAIKCIALCHNVTPVIEADGNVEYQASSPDEVALVKFTESVGLTLVQRDVGYMILRRPDGTEQRFAILAVFPFTSASKRMGIITRNLNTGLITFYEKGADVVMKDIVKPSNWLEEECTNLAREGLRTLVFGYKHLTEEDYVNWDEEMKKAKISTDNRAENIQAVLGQLEKSLELVGVTGVEDKLQKDVQRSLEELRNAGIKVWMLTGDKVETAICIARSTKLVDRGQQIVHISGKTYLEILNQLNDFARMAAEMESEGIAIVMDGSTLTICLEQLQTRMLQEASKCKAVIICRCSPTQKAEVVRGIIRHNPGKRCAAIGDGGNDVSMIQASHVGIGIVGKEGKHASLAADFSIEQFSYCKSLILWHGRNSYLRSAKLAQFIFHRGLIISIIQAVFSSIFYFASVPIYTGWLMVGYTTIFTNFPVFSLVLDEDVTEENVLLFPELYSELQKGRALNFKSFLQWVWMACYQGGVIMLLACALFVENFLQIVSITFTALILTELIMVAYEMHRRGALFFVIAQLASLASYGLAIVCLPTYFDRKFMMSRHFWWKVVIMVAGSCLPIYVARFVYRRLNPPAYVKLRAL